MHIIQFCRGEIAIWLLWLNIFAVRDLVQQRACMYLLQFLFIISHCFKYCLGGWERNVLLISFTFHKYQFFPL